MRNLAASIVAASMLMVPAGASAAIVNGGFETVDDRTGITNSNALNNLNGSSPTWDVYSDLPGGWTTNTGDLTPTPTNDDSLFGPGIEVHYTGTVVSAFEGSHYIELDSDTANGPNDVGADTNTRMGQSLSLNPNTNYTLEFAYQPRTNQTNDNGIRYEVINGLLLSSEVTGTGQSGWQPIAANFATGSSGDVNLFFEAFEADNTLGGFLDDIRIIEGEPVQDVPVPATLALLGMGLIGLGAMARRRR